jgi:hypothetical protein
MDLDHPALLDLDWEGVATVVRALNRLIRDADERGFRFQLRLDGGDTVDLTGERVGRVVWRDADGRDYHYTDLDVVTVTEASQLAGIKRSTLYQRVLHAEQRGEVTPFLRVGLGAGTLCAPRQSALDWIEDWRRKTPSTL